VARKGALQAKSLPFNVAGHPNPCSKTTGPSAAFPGARVGRDSSAAQRDATAARVPVRLYGGISVMWPTELCYMSAVAATHHWQTADRPEHDFPLCGSKRTCEGLFLPDRFRCMRPFLVPKVARGRNPCRGGRQDA